MHVCKIYSKGMNFDFIRRKLTKSTSRSKRGSVKKRSQINTPWSVDDTTLQARVH